MATIYLAVEIRRSRRRPEFLLGASFTHSGALRLIGDSVDTTLRFCSGQDAPEHVVSQLLLRRTESNFDAVASSVLVLCECSAIDETCRTCRPVLAFATLKDFVDYLAESAADPESFRLRHGGTKDSLRVTFELSIVVLDERQFCDRHVQLPLNVDRLMRSFYWSHRRSRELPREILSESFRPFERAPLAGPNSRWPDDVEKSKRSHSKILQDHYWNEFRNSSRASELSGKWVALRSIGEHRSYDSLDALLNDSEWWDASGGFYEEVGQEITMCGRILLESYSSDCERAFLAVRRLSGYSEPDLFVGISRTDEGARKLLDGYRRVLAGLGYDPHVDQAYMTVDLDDDLFVQSVPLRGVLDVAATEAILLCEESEGFGQISTKASLAFGNWNDLFAYLTESTQDAATFRQRHGIGGCFPSRLIARSVLLDGARWFNVVCDLPTELEILLQSLQSDSSENETPSQVLVGGDRSPPVSRLENEV